MDYWKYIENQERFYLYLILSVTAAIILCLILIIGRLLIQRHRVRRNNNKIKKEFQTSNTGETTLPNGFGDDISEIDGDIDLTTSLPLPSVSRNDVSAHFSFFCCRFYLFLFFTAKLRYIYTVTKSLW